MFMVSSLLLAKELNTSSADINRSNKRGSMENQSPNISVLNINNIAYWMAKDGAYTTAGSQNGTQADYPIFTGGFIFAEGMLWGAKVKGDGQGDGVRVGGSTYGHGLKAGRIITDANGNVIGSDDPANNHVWRVRKDWATADLTVDAANFYGVGAGEVSATQISTVKGQYEYDWMNWPAEWGAPYDDINGDGSFDPSVDIPGYPGSDQTVWTVANDVPYVVDENGTVVDTINTAPNLYGSDPIGIELQITMWGYAFGASDPLGNNVFKKATMKYMGLPETLDGAMLDSLYFTQWSDPDLGTYTDDYVGCDVDLSFGYVYNGNRLDGVFNGIFNLPVPAGGYDFLQGPPDNMDIDEDGDTEEYLGMTSFTYFGAGSSISDPDLSEYAGSLQFFNLMEGYLPRPEYPTQIPFTDPISGEETKFVLSGDPTSGAGWIDGIQLPPGDRRMVMASGPFMLNLGEQADVVLGVAAGMGLDNVSSVSVAKFHDLYGQYAYDKGFSLPSAPASPVVSGLEMDGAIGLDWGGDSDAVNATETIISENFEFEGYVVYQLPSAGSPLSEGVKVATYDKINLVQNILDPSIDPITGLVVDAAKQTGTDAGVQRYFETDYDEVRGRPMSNGVTYHFAVTAYSYLPQAYQAGSPFKTLESSETRVAVTPHSANPGVTVHQDMGSMVDVTHNGTANASVEVKVINPSALTGDSYGVSFSEQAYWVGSDGAWTTSDPNAAKVGDVSPSSVSGVYLTNPDPSTIDVVLNVSVVSPDYNYAAGVNLIFPEGTIINSASEGGGAVTMISGNEVMFGSTTQDGSGYFAGGEVLIINIDKPSGFPTDLAIDYVVYDDAWATLWCPNNCETCEAYSIGVACDGSVFTEPTDATGQALISDLTYYVQIEKFWSLKNMTTNTVLLDKQTWISGSDAMVDEFGSSAGSMSSMTYSTSATPTTEGFQVYVNGNYAAPVDAFDHVVTADEEAAALYGESIYDIDSYYYNGWAASALANDVGYDYTGDGGYTHGVTSVDTLQRDIEIRFTGEYDENNFITFDPGDGSESKYILCEQDADGNCIGGSYAWISGARNYDLSVHPDPGNVDKDDLPFRIWVPFEVWDMEHPDGPQQIDVDIYDRIQTPDNPDDPGFMYSFNPYNRMYTTFIHTAYNDSGVYNSPRTGDPLGYHTWNAAWWDTQFNKGDVVTFKYANPILVGVDEFVFSTTGVETVVSNDVSNVSVYPNPYYGTHELESSRADKYVSFNNLPSEATIDIYSLGGVYVKSIHKHDASQFAQWDLKNQYGYPVASGLYIARIESGGNEKILKIALVQETQVLKYY